MFNIRYLFFFLIIVMAFFSVRKAQAQSNMRFDANMMNDTVTLNRISDLEINIFPTDNSVLFFINADGFPFLGPGANFEDIEIIQFPEFELEAGIGQQVSINIDAPDLDFDGGSISLSDFDVIRSITMGNSVETFGVSFFLEFNSADNINSGTYTEPAYIQITANIQ